MSCTTKWMQSQTTFILDCQIKSPSLQGIRLSTSTNNWLAFRPRKASKVGKPSSRGVGPCIAVVPNAATRSLAHALALSAHTYVCQLVPFTFDWFPQCYSFPELGPMTQTDISASSWLHINMAISRPIVGSDDSYDLVSWNLSWGYFAWSRSISWGGQFIEVR